MRKAALFYNPLSGRRRARRLANVEAVVAVLRQAGIERPRGTHARPGRRGRTGAPGHRLVDVTPSLPVAAMAPPMTFSRAWSEAMPPWASFRWEGQCAGHDLRLPLSP